MAKKINFIVVDRTTIELAENANKGDIIDLANANQVDERNLQEAIEQAAWNKAQEIAKPEIDKVKHEYEVKEAKLQAELKSVKDNQEAAIKNEILEEKAKLEKANADKIAKLEKDLALSKETNESAVKLAIAKVEKDKSQEINDLKLENSKIESKLKETEAQWQHRFMSTKSYGEELEQFIYQEFEAAQQNGAFPNAKFYKDNEVISSGEGLKGTKGDFVFRDYDDKGNCILSIEIEVKTEQSTDAKTKTHNKDHYKKLDSDRTKKDCEYAVLISELEKTNKNFDGIYKVRDYEKMYVVRPQSFLGLISILKDSLNKNRELVAIIEQKKHDFQDQETFVNNLNDVKDAVNKTVEMAHKNFSNAIEEIDKTIDHLTKVRDELVKSGNKLRIANDKVTGITVRKLTRGCEDDPFKK